MAIVYLADDLRHDRHVALKVLRHELAASLATNRFLLEIRVTARLQHAHILPLLDSGEIPGPGGTPTPFYVMPYVEGESLRDRLAREHQLPVDTALNLAGDVTAALAHAHAHGVVHRDVKPENILLSGRDQTLEALVVDFGIASAVSTAGGTRLTETGLVLGTPHYMSPEQAAGDPGTDARTDIYAAGCVLYEMLAGEPPHTGPTAQAIIARAMTAPTPTLRTQRPTVPQEVDQLIQRATAKVPADRFQSAAEMHEALADARTPGRPDAQAPGRPDARRPGRALAVMAGMAVVAVAALLLIRGRSAHPQSVITSASSIAVLPPTPSVTDTALARLGRDLVFTLTAELDGLGGIRTADAHTVLARTRQQQPGDAAGQAELGRSLGAGSYLQGSLVRVGPAVRLDLTLLPTDSSTTPIARATVTAPPDSVAALTDSAVRALIPQLWSRGTPPTPSLDAALRTRSVPALRAFLKGEGEMSHGQWEDAATSYEGAMVADGTFWLAYARHLFARYWALTEPADTVLTKLREHLAELPDRDRLAAAGILVRPDSVARALDHFQELTRRYPDYWYGWLLYGDALLHEGPALGYTIADARVAFEKATVLNADLIPAWEHLALASLVANDSVGTRQAIEALDRLNAGPVLTADGYGNRMLQFRFLQAAQRGDTAQVARLADSIARDPAPAAVTGSFYDGYGFGFFPQQLMVSRRALMRGVAPQHRQFHEEIIPLSLLGRGAWDSALAGLDAHVAQGMDSLAALRTYGIAGLGVWLGAIDPGEASKRRERAHASARTPSERADVAWIDGVLAASRKDRAGLEQARAELARSGDSTAALLDRSLGALDAAMRGDTAGAGSALAQLELGEARTSSPGFVNHPLVIPLDRLAGARFLAASGRGEDALRLLRWADGPFLPHPTTTYTMAFAPLADFERGRIESRLQHPEPARAAYARYLSRQDLPPAAHKAMVAEARAALASP